MSGPRTRQQDGYMLTCEGVNLRPPAAEHRAPRDEFKINDIDLFVISSGQEY